MVKVFQSKFRPKTSMQNSAYTILEYYKYFHYILQLVYQLFNFYTYSFYSLSILLYHMTDHIHSY